MRARSTRHRQHRRGANAVEFALTFPVFLLISFGMIEFGWYFSQVAAVNSASLDGCRQGALVDEANPGDRVSPTHTALQQMNNRLSLFGLNCGGDCTAIVNGPVPGRYIQCDVRVDYEPITGFLPAPSEILSTTRTRLEWQRNI